MTDSSAVLAIRAQGLQKAYGEVHALDGLDLEVARGTVHGLLGPNGAGKTTFLRRLLGLVRLDGGDLHIEGTVGGFVEAPGAYPYLTGRQNLDLLAGLDDVPGDVGEALARVGLADRSATKVAGWSLGMRQRLGIAAALMRQPDVLVLDEPANGLDPSGARALRELIRELAASGLTVLLCSHDLSEVEATCQDISVVVAGRRVWSGTVVDLRGRSDRAVLSTSDDAAAGAHAPAGVAVEPRRAGGLTVQASTVQLDDYVLRLAAHGIAVRSLVHEALTLEQAFLDLAS
ncbi:MAG: type transport system ATP-binding protein [Actinomycetota bacterium]|nr:type transport system ATP-binding protein [Actinomycetota bacterium]